MALASGWAGTDMQDWLPLLFAAIGLGLCAVGLIVSRYVSHDEPSDDASLMHDISKFLN